MAERLLGAQPDSVANHITARQISINVSNALIRSICSAFFYFDLFILINRGDIFKQYNVVTYLLTCCHLDPPVPCGTMGSRFRQRTRSSAIVSFSLQLTPLACRSSLNVDRQVFFGGQCCQCQINMNR